MLINKGKGIMVGMVKLSVKGMFKEGVSSFGSCQYCFVTVRTNEFGVFMFLSYYFPDRKRREAGEGITPLSCTISGTNFSRICSTTLNITVNS